MLLQEGRRVWRHVIWPALPSQLSLTTLGILPPPSPRSTAAPAALLVTVGQGVFRSLQDMRTPLALAAAANAVHLALSLALIFPGAMGLTGAALSTSVAEWLAAGGFGGERSW